MSASQPASQWESFALPESADASKNRCRGFSGVPKIWCRRETVSEHHLQLYLSFRLWNFVYTVQGFSLNSGYMKMLCTQEMDLVLFLVSQRFCAHQINLLYIPLITNFVNFLLNWFHPIPELETHKSRIFWFLCVSSISIFKLTLYDKIFQI